MNSRCPKCILLGTCIKQLGSQGNIRGLLQVLPRQDDFCFLSWVVRWLRFRFFHVFYAGRCARAAHLLLLYFSTNVSRLSHDSLMLMTISTSEAEPSVLQALHCNIAHIMSYFICRTTTMHLLFWQLMRPWPLMYPSISIWCTAHF